MKNLNKSQVSRECQEKLNNMWVKKESKGIFPHFIS